MRRGIDEKHFSLHQLTLELRNIPSSCDIKMGFNISNALKESIICDGYQPLSLASIISSSLLKSPVIPLGILVSASESMAVFIDEDCKTLKQPISMENQLITEPKFNTHKISTRWKKKRGKKWYEAPKETQKLNVK